jgi:hypothetical protein
MKRTWLLHVLGYATCLILLLVQSYRLRDLQETSVCLESQLAETEHRLQGIKEWDCATRGAEMNCCKQLIGLRRSLKSSQKYQEAPQ